MNIKENINEVIFKEYDIRGVYAEQIDADTAYTIGLSYGSYLKLKFNFTTCLVGHDNRLSSEELNNALIKGILETGCNVIDMGLCTTPMLYNTRYLKNLPGIMVTASHNPAGDNGFKFSFDNLCNARGEMIHDFKDYTLGKEFIKGTGTLSYIDITNEFYNELHKNINMGDRKLKVLIDPANGTSANFVHIAHDIYSNLEIDYINDISDGNFPNHHPDPNEPENLSVLAKLVKEGNYDLGISYDGDGDRVGIIDEQGNWIAPDYLMIITIRDIINSAANKTFSYDVKCTKALEDEITKLGGIPVIYRSGASFAQAKVIDDNLIFGGEYSGHLYFNDRMFPHTCGIYSGLRYLEILSHTDKNFSELLNGVTIYKNYPEEKIPCEKPKKQIVINAIKNYCIEKNYSYLDIDGIRVQFDDGWALVRPSNTGPNLTTRYEALTTERLDELKKEFDSLVYNLLKD